MFNTATGLYDISTIQRGTADQDSNTLPIHYGITPANMQASVLQKLKAALYRANGPVVTQGSTLVEAFYTGWEVFARFDAQDTAGALDLIRLVWDRMRKGSPYYTGAVWEKILAADGLPGLGEGTSLAHPWGSAPTAALSKYVLGVRPVEAGYKKWRIEPQTGDLTWAAGTVPTPYGPIEAIWWRTSRGLSLKVTVPPGTRGSVGLPGAANSAVSKTSANLNDLAPGTYVIELP